MTTLALTQTKLMQGIWQGLVTGAQSRPEIEVTHQNTSVEGVTLIAGDAMGDDIRAEMDLLRAELDMLKRAFRRHCLETS